MEWVGKIIFDADGGSCCGLLFGLGLRAGGGLAHGVVII